MVIIFVCLMGMSASFASDSTDDLQTIDETDEISIANTEDNLQDDVSQSGEDSQSDESNLGAVSDDDVVGENDGTFAELKEIITTNTNGTVDLYKDYLKEDDFEYDGIIINKQLKIDGHGHTLDANFLGSIFKVTTKSKLIFHNLTFKDATSTAITFSKVATVDFINCNFIDNSRENRVTYSQLYGAAILFESDLINSTFDNVVFKNNTIFSWEKASSVIGAAISIKGNAINNVFKNSNFDENMIHDENYVEDGIRQYQGAAIAFVGLSQNNNFTNTVFNNNHVQGNTGIHGIRTTKYYGQAYGGALYFGGNSYYTNFVSCNFTKNWARASGGAIFFQADAENCNFINSTFDSNRARYDYVVVGHNILIAARGGAIYIENSVNNVFENLTFSNNQARLGGAISFYGGEDNRFSNINFTENTAYSSEVNYESGGNPYQNPFGGAMHMQNIHSSTFENVNFINNVAKDGHTESQVFKNIYAGAVYFQSSSDILFKNTVFSHNTAKNQGGAVYADSLTNLTFENVNFTSNGVNSRENNKGGAICIVSSNGVNFNNVNFDDNSLVDKFSYYQTSSIANYALGGAAYISISNNVTFNNVNFTNNLLKADCRSFTKTGDECMGIVYLSGSNFTFEEVNFINNTVSAPEAEFVGGGIIASDSAVDGLKLNNVYVVNTTSSQKGAIYLISTSTKNIVINNTVFENNNAHDGAAIYMTGNNVEIVNTEFKNNNATRYAGAVYVSGKGYTMDNVNFTNNALSSTSSEGGAIYANGWSSATLKNINFINNSAYNSASAVFINSGSNIVISDSNFTKNSLSTSDRSGVVSANCPFNITRCNFTDNVCNFATISAYGKNDASDYLVVDDTVFDGKTGIYVIHTYNTPLYVNEINISNFNGYDVIYSYSSRNNIIKNSNFTNNTCEYGVVYLYGESYYPAQFEHVRFINNTCAQSGGAIDAYNSGMNINDAYFDGNVAKENGGSIVAYSSTNVGMEHVTIKNSRAGQDGGAIYMDTGSQLTFNHGVIENNTAGIRGGAIYSSYSFDIDDVNFTDNVANQYGGALYISYYNTVNINNSDFTHNGVNITGGAIYIDQGSSVNIELSDFHYNYASNGSAIDNYGTLNIKDSTFDKNKANSTSLIIDFNRYTNETNVTYTGGDNYINAIQSTDDITFSNVSYYDYQENALVSSETVTPVNSYYKSNQKIVIKVYDENNEVIETIEKYTDSNGKLYIDSVNSNRHHMTASREDDDYYTYIESDFLCIWGDFTILQRLIEGLSDNDVLNLTRDYTYTIGADYITEGIIINKTNFTINGNGYTINALFKSRIFELFTSNVKFYNIHFANASGMEGAFIHGIGVNNTEIINCTFMNTFDFSISDYAVYPEPNNDDSGNPGGYFPGEEPVIKIIDESYVGSAVYIVGNYLDVDNSNFTNIVAHIGGSIFFEGNNTSISNSKFNNTKAAFGGALYLNGDNVTIDGCEFYNNTAQFAGGAILAVGNNHSINDSIFTDCRIIEDDLGYWSNIDNVILSWIDSGEPANPGNDYNDPPITIITRGLRSSSLNDPVLTDPGLGADPSGPGVLVPVEPTGPVMNYRGGGAIYTEVINFDVTKSQFISCHANSLGGAILADGINTNITDTNFTSCDAVSGGAVLISVNAVNSTIENCIFDNNSAKINGGAVSWYADNGTLIDSTFKNNHKFIDIQYQRNSLSGGGAVLWFGKNGIADNCDFTNNSFCTPCDDYLDIIRQNEDISNEEAMEMIERNIGSEYSLGGAFLIRGGSINITNCNFTDNSAQSGGAIAMVNYNPSYTDEVFEQSQNYDFSEVTIPKVNISDCKFNNNFAQYAGAVLITGYNNNIHKSEFINNTALIAGAVNLRGTSSVISNSSFKDNAAVVAGAVLSGFTVLDPDVWGEYEGLSGYNNSIIDSEFFDNCAQSSGAILWLDDVGSIKNTKFIRNGINELYQRYSQTFKEIYGIELNESLYAKMTDQYWVIPMDSFIYDVAGTIGWIGDEGLIDNCEFDTGRAFAGSAIFWRGNSGTINNSTFKNYRGYDLNVSDNDYSVELYIYNCDVYEPYYPQNGELDELYDRCMQENLQNVLDQHGISEASLIKSYYEKEIVGYDYYNNIKRANANFYYHLLVNNNPQVMESKSMGTVLWIGENGLINDTDFIDNAACMGGALVSGGYNLTVNNSNFINNSANKGGAIYWAGECGMVDKSKFIDNKGYSDYEENILYNHTYVTVSSQFTTGNSKTDVILFSTLKDVLDEVSESYKFDNISIYDYSYTYYRDYYNGGYIVNITYCFDLVNAKKYSRAVPSNGGAIYWQSPNALITDSEFENNCAFDGGAVYLEGEEGQIIGSTFKKNHGNTFNNPYMINKEKIAFYESSFEYHGYYSNSIIKEYVYNNLNGATAKVSQLYGGDAIVFDSYYYDVTMIGEPDYEGEGKYNVKVTFVFNITNHSQDLNPSGPEGGAVYINSYGNLINNCKFYENNASAGGALYINDYGNCINDSTFENNSVYKFNKITTSQDVSSFTETIGYFSDSFNSYDEALIEGKSYAYRHISELYDEYDADEIKVTYNVKVTLVDQFMDWYYYYSVESIEYNVTLINYVNKTDESSFGGAIYVNDVENLINSTKFVNNQAEFGGAVYINAIYVLVNASEFTANNAEYGAAMYVNGNEVYVVGTSFELNKAYLAGAIYWDGADGIVMSSKFLNNTAFDGGAIYYTGNNNTISDNSLFKYNKADVGSALYVKATGLKLLDSTFLENQAKSYSITYNTTVMGDKLLVHVVFVGKDNFINAIYTENECEIHNIIYCPVDNDGNPQITDLEDGINITFKISDYTEGKLREYSAFTNITGETTVEIPVSDGYYLLTAEHKEDNYYTGISRTEFIQIGMMPTIMEISVEDIFYKENATIIVHVPGDVTGNITIALDGKNITSQVIDRGMVSIEVPNLPGGTYNVTAYYEGNENHPANSTSKIFHVKPIETSLIVLANGGIYGTDLPVNVSIADNDVTGKVMIYINDIYGSTFIITDSNNLSGVIKGLDVGTYNITAFYTGDNSYLNATNKTTFNVTPSNINGKASATDVTTEENTTFLIDVPETFAGKANITVGNITQVYDISGPTRVAFVNLAEGDKSATIQLYGDNNYNNQNLTTTFKVSKAIHIGGFGTVHSNDMKRGWGSPYDYQAEFLDADGNALANSDVVFKVNGTEYTAKTNKDGIAQLTTSKLDVGVYDIVSVNQVTGEEVTNKLEIVGRIIQSNDLTMDFRDGSSFVVKVVGDDGNDAPKGEIVSISANGVYYPAVVGDNGIAKLKINLNPKKYTVVAEYKSFKVKHNLVVKQTLKLAKKTVSIKKSSKKLVLKATLKWSNGKAIKGKVIKFKFKGKTYKAKTDAKGIAKVTVKKNVIKKLKKGKKYAYSATYYTNTVKGAVKVKK